MENAAPLPSFDEMDFLGTEGRELLTALESETQEDKSEAGYPGLKIKGNSNVPATSQQRGGRSNRGKWLSGNETFPSRENMKQFYDEDEAKSDDNTRLCRPYLMPLEDDLELKLRHWSEKQREKVRV